MRIFLTLAMTTLIAGLELNMPVRAGDGQACLDIIKRANDLGAQIKEKRKQAENEDECHAETKYWGETLDLLNAKIVIEQKVKEICAGFTITGGQTVEDLQATALKVRKWQAAANDGCDPPASPKAPPPSSAGGELIGSGTITCFGNGNCGGKEPTVVTQPHDTPTKPAPRTNQSTITGDRFGDKRPPSTDPGLVAPAK